MKFKVNCPYNCEKFAIKFWKKFHNFLNFFYTILKKIENFS
jgi:hypothetical protein